MSPQERIDEALDAAIDALARDAGVDGALAAADGHAAALGPLVQTAADLRASAAAGAPAPQRLADNYAIVRAAVERAQIAVPVAAPKRTWWNRRVAFASLSLPAGALVLALSATAAGAAASIATTDVGSDIASAMRPEWVEDVIGNGNKGGNSAEHRQNPPKANGGNSGDNPAAPGGDAPGAVNRPTAVEVSGTISDIRGNTFTLTNGEGAWSVQTDGMTEITGEVLDGANATVTGERTADKNVHATSVSATGGTPAVAPGSKPEDAGTPPEAAPTKTPKPDTGPPSTPPANSGPPVTPPGRSGGNSGPAVQ